MLALISAAAGFEFFGGTSDFLLKENIFFQVNTITMPIAAVIRLIFVTGLPASLSYQCSAVL
jgi:hypothetical protein